MRASSGRPATGVDTVRLPQWSSVSDDPHSRVERGIRRRLVVLIAACAALGYGSADRGWSPSQVAIVAFYVGLDSGWWGSGPGDGWQFVMIVVAAAVTAAAVASVASVAVEPRACAFAWLWQCSSCLEAAARLRIVRLIASLFLVVQLDGERRLDRAATDCWFRPGEAVSPRAPARLPGRGRVDVALRRSHRRGGGTATRRPAACRLPMAFVTICR
jgi:hypothetical protein